MLGDLFDRRIQCRRGIMLCFIATLVNLGALGFAIGPAKFHHLVPKWTRAGKSLVNMQKHRKYKKGVGLIFEI